MPNTRLARARLAQQNGAGLDIPAPPAFQTGSEQKSAGTAAVGVTHPSDNTARAMAVAPQSLKDPQILLLRAEVKSANVAVDNIAKEIVNHLKDVEAAKSFFPF